MAGPGGIFAPLAMRALRHAVGSTARVLRKKLADATARQSAGQPQLQTVAVRSRPQPVHPAAILRQQKSGRWFSTTSTAYNNARAVARRLLSTKAAPAPRNAHQTSSRTSRAISAFPGRAPFASTLRPNLTGGALPRTAGGYGMPGSGARAFSHTPAAPAQVVQNVSQAVRAFWLSGQRARFDGYSDNGQRKFCAVSVEQEERMSRMHAGMVPMHGPGSFVDFQLSPTVTALTPLAALGEAQQGVTAKPALAMVQANTSTLNEEGFLDVLSVDFARSLKDLAAVMNDVKRLAALGDLPVQSLDGGRLLRVRFPGVDAETAERLCDDVGVQRGVVGQDSGFDDASADASVHLKMPFAPDGKVEHGSLASGGPRPCSTPIREAAETPSSSEEDASLLLEDYFEENPWLADSPALSQSDAGHDGYVSLSPPVLSSGEHCSEELEGLEGIYRFIDECDRAQAHSSSIR